MSDDYGDRARFENAGRRQDVVDHGESGDMMEHLRSGGLHPRAFARGENDDVKLRHAIDYRAVRVLKGRRRSRGRTGRGRRLEGCSKRFVVAQGFQVRIRAGEGPVFGIERDGAFEVRDRFGVLVTLRVCNGEHVDGVVVVRVLVPHETQMSNGLIVMTAINRQRGSIEAFFERLRCALLRRHLPLADVQIEANAFQKLLFLWKLNEDRFEQLGCPPVIVALECLQASLIDRDGFEVGRSPLG